MPTICLVVERGSAKGQSFPVPQDVCRVGSGRHVTLRVAGIHEWAFTLLRKDNDYFVLHRGCEDLRIGDALVAPGSKTSWRLGQTMLLDGTTLLRLTCDATATTTDWEHVAPKVVPIRNAGSAEKREPKLRQGTIVLASMAIVLAYLFMFLPRAESRIPVRRMYRTLMARLDSQPLRDVPRYQRARKWLWQGMAAEELYHDPTAAHEFYSKLKQTLEQVDTPTSDQNLELGLKRFVMHRLAALPRSS